MGLPLCRCILSENRGKGCGMFLHLFQITLCNAAITHVHRHTRARTHTHVHTQIHTHTHQKHISCHNKISHLFSNLSQIGPLSLVSCLNGQPDRHLVSQSGWCPKAQCSLPGTSGSVVAYHSGTLLVIAYTERECCCLFLVLISG